MGQIQSKNEKNGPAIGIVGCGYAAKRHVDDLADRSEGHIAAMCDPNTQTRDELVDTAKSQGVLANGPTLGESVTDIPFEELDGVIIATPHQFHCEQIVTTLNHDLAVLVEKPLAVNEQEVQTIQQALNASDGSLWVGYQKRLKPRYWTAKRLIEDGEIGEIESISAHRIKHTDSPYNDEWRANPEVAGGGQLFDIGNHVLDLILWLSERSPESVAATLAPRADADTEVYANVIGKLQGNIPYSLSLHAYGPPSIEQIYISGSDASLQVTKSGVRLYRPDETIDIPADTGDFERPIDVLLNLSQGSKHDDSFETWADSVSLTKQAYESLDQQ